VALREPRNNMALPTESTVTLPNPFYKHGPLDGGRAGLLSVMVYKHGPPDGGRAGLLSVMVYKHGPPDGGRRRAGLRGL
jgi:hypothetical protein